MSRIFKEFEEIEASGHACELENDGFKIHFAISEIEVEDSLEKATFVRLVLISPDGLEMDFQLVENNDETKFTRVNTKNDEYVPIVEPDDLMWSYIRFGLNTVIHGTVNEFGVHDKVHGFKTKIPEYISYDDEQPLQAVHDFLSDLKTAGNLSEAQATSVNYAVEEVDVIRLQAHDALIKQIRLQIQAGKPTTARAIMPKLIGSMHNEPGKYRIKNFLGVTFLTEDFRYRKSSGGSLVPVFAQQIVAYAETPIESYQALPKYNRGKTAPGNETDYFMLGGDEKKLLSLRLKGGSGCWLEFSEFDGQTGEPKFGGVNKVQGGKKVWYQSTLIFEPETLAKEAIEDLLQRGPKPTR